MKTKIFDEIVVKRKICDWEAVVDYAAEYFTGCQAADMSYFDAIKRDMIEMDAYMVLAPGVVLLHSRPENGCLKTVFHLMTLDPPVCFHHAENDPVDVVITFTSLSGGEHMEAIQTLAFMLMDGVLMQQIRSAKTPEEVCGYLTPFEAKMKGNAYA